MKLQAQSRTVLFGRVSLLALLAGYFAIVGLALVALGLYGVLSYSVVQRTREIGIRIALGARHAAIVLAIASDAGAAALAGGVVGIAAAIYASRYVETLLFEVTPFDFWSVTLPVGVLCLASAAAAAIPARRMTRVDPVIALRQE